MADTNIPEISIPSTSNGTTEILGIPPNTYCMLLHLSQLLNFCFPPCGIIVPIVMWAIGKDKSAQVDQHGKIILNWLISLFIYVTASTALAVGFSITIMVMSMGFLPPIGFLLLCPFLFLLTILAVVFPIIGAVKANNGIAWKYPLCISFFK